MYFKYKNTQIYYEKHNTSNDNIIILPGWGNNRITFNNIINNLKDKKIYILDYPGFGKSKPLKEEYTIYDYAELIYNFIKKPKNNYLNINKKFYTLSISNDSIWSISEDGKVYESSVDIKLGVRISLYLENSVILEGKGTFENPYKIVIK